MTSTSRRSSVRTPDGSTRTVTGINDQQGLPSTTVYDLTVADLHTFYVLAGNAPVLVHNSTCFELENSLAAAESAKPLIESLQKRAGFRLIM
ncbi:hypothetical protein ACFZB9_35365 [Kitasatospora sp. NPDC008050]|uniref:hypothetical protein n=1 Tax=Kitasatospora sp. NPDC008050 TaxID=3364021 RepID=UPI0036E218B7